MRQGRDVNQAFSLVEVTIAIGIVGFCLIALLGLYSTGLTSNRQASTDTILASTSSLMAANIEAQENFDFTKSYYFDHFGVPLSSGAQATFVCQVNTALVSDSEVNGVSPHLVRATLKFSWPFPNNAQTQSFHVTLPPR